jgi:hypothetical protein
VTRHQGFVAKDRIRLQVGQRPTTVASQNLIKNPSGALGAWGWLTPAASTELASTQAQDAPSLSPASLRITTAGSDPSIVSEPQPCAPGAWVRASLYVAQAPSAGFVMARIRFLNAAGAVLLENNTGTAISTSTAVGARISVPALQAPANTTSVQLRILCYSSTATRTFAFYNAMLSVVTSSGAALPAFSEPYLFTDIVGSSHTITVERPGNLQPGSLKALVLDANLDPATSTLIRPGNPVRLLALSSDASWQPVFCGEVLNGGTTYDLTHKIANKRARVELTAVDATKTAANQVQPVGVRRVEELGFLAEGASIPWRVNRDTRQITGYPVMVSRNENASLLDQVAITRDTTLGLASISRFGRLEVADSGMVDVTRMSTFLDADYLKDVLVDFDMSRCVNEVTVKDLSLDVEGKTVETVHGPYRNEASIRTWGRFAQEFIRQTPEAFAPATYAAFILNNNGTPTRSVRQLSFRVMSADNATGDFRHGALSGSYRRRVFLDLNDPVRVENTRAGLAQDLRVASIKHTITAKRWSVDVGFATTAGAAMPIGTPAPPMEAQPAYTPGKVLSRWGTTPSLVSGTSLPNDLVVRTTHYIPDGPTIPAGARKALLSYHCPVNNPYGNCAVNWTLNARIVGAVELAPIYAGTSHNNGQLAMDVGISLTLAIDVEGHAGKEIEMWANAANHAGSAGWCAIGNGHFFVTFES